MGFVERILDHRKKNRPFKRIEDLMNVPGIGEKKFFQLEDRFRVGEPASGNPQDFAAEPKTW